ncbi:hypothetical protein MRX96_002451 [Rhipicephalus microplus]
MLRVARSAVLLLLKPEEHSERCKREAGGARRRAVSRSDAAVVSLTLDLTLAQIRARPVEIEGCFRIGEEQWRSLVPTTGFSETSSIRVARLWFKCVGFGDASASKAVLPTQTPSARREILSQSQEASLSPHRGRYGIHHRPCRLRERLLIDSGASAHARWASYITRKTIWPRSPHGDVATHPTARVAFSPRPGPLSAILGKQLADVRAEFGILLSAPNGRLSLFPLRNHRRGRVFAFLCGRTRSSLAPALSE